MSIQQIILFEIWSSNKIFNFLFIFFIAPIAVEQPMEIKEDSPPPKLVEKKKERVPSSEPIPYVGLAIPSVNGDFAPIKETTTKKSGRQRRGQTAASTLQSTASEEVSR